MAIVREELLVSAAKTAQCDVLCPLTITHKMITEIIPKQFRFGSLVPPPFPKQFGKGFGKPVLTFLTETK